MLKRLALFPLHLVILRVLMCKSYQFALILAIPSILSAAIIPAAQFIESASCPEKTTPDAHPDLPGTASASCSASGAGFSGVGIEYTYSGSASSEITTHNRPSFSGTVTANARNTEASAFAQAQIKYTVQVVPKFPTGEFPILLISGKGTFAGIDNAGPIAPGTPVAEAWTQVEVDVCCEISDAVSAYLSSRDPVSSPRSFAVNTLSGVVSQNAVIDIQVDAFLGARAGYPLVFDEEFQGEARTTMTFEPIIELAPFSQQFFTLKFSPGLAAVPEPATFGTTAFVLLGMSWLAKISRNSFRR